MKVIVQRSKESSVKVGNNVVGSIKNGIVLLVGFTYGDSIEEIDYMAKKIVNLRIFDDSNGVMNKSLMDIDGQILSISQFTLYGDASKGNRPSYINALKSEDAKKLYSEFNKKLIEYNVEVQTGIFGSEMEVSIINDGPVTIILEKNSNNNCK